MRVKEKTISDDIRELMRGIMIIALFGALSIVINIVGIIIPHVLSNTRRGQGS